jgi:hypothetical protein
MRGATVTRLSSCNGTNGRQRASRRERCGDDARLLQHPTGAKQDSTSTAPRASSSHEVRHDDAEQR